jgi:NTE family protein
LKGETMKPATLGQTAQKSFSFINWIFFRLPLGFSLSFTALTLWWIFYGFRLASDLVAWQLPHIATIALEAALPAVIAEFLAKNLEAFLSASVTILIFFLGLLIAYNVSALVNWVLVRAGWKPIRYPTGTPYIVDTTRPLDREFDTVDRIGIVLAGGGAKGAFQAGAMKAIYRYLDEKNALGKVKVIAGTSIGSWNALFWLADLIRPDDSWNGTSAHERWWQLISAKSLTAPSWYVPFLRNAFLSSTPWQQVFDHIFLRQDVTNRIATTGIHFYLTRSNVTTGKLECATNNPAPPPIAGVSYERLDPAGNRDSFMQGLRTGVFASMDLPPLFPYIKRNGKVFEDGGVIDNVPIVFAAVEPCDLVFVLPLNSDFEERPNESSVFARLFRVMDVRQGVLERHGFKMVYLYNEIAALRQDAQALRRQQGLPITLAWDTPLATALRRRNQHINVFAVCPLKVFVDDTIGTQEFWKHREAARVFRVMYEATWGLLPSFQFNQPEYRVRMALVSEGGQVTWDESF